MPFPVCGQPELSCKHLNTYYSLRSSWLYQPGGRTCKINNREGTIIRYSRVDEISRMHDYNLVPKTLTDYRGPNLDTK